MAELLNAESKLVRKTYQLKNKKIYISYPTSTIPKIHPGTYPQTGTAISQSNYFNRVLSKINSKTTNPKQTTPYSIF